MQAQAAVATKPWHVEQQTVSVPDPTPQDVVVRTVHSWISNGTEGSFVRGERIAGDTPRQPHDPLPFPHVPGYQKVGVVEWVGSEVPGVSVGERVFATVSKIEGMFYNFAGHVSPAVTHGSQIWKLPPDTDPVAYSGMVLTQVGYNVGACAPVQAGDYAVVLGDGMVGHWSAQTFQARGARVMLVGKHDDRLNLLELGEGDCVVNLNREDPLEAVKAWAKGGAHLLADTVGALETVEALYPAMRRFSHLISAGFYGERGRIDIQKMRNYEMCLHAPAGWHPDRMNTTRDWIQRGLLTTSHLITHRFPVARVSDAFDLILLRKEPVLGVVLDW